MKRDALVMLGWDPDGVMWRNEAIGGLDSPPSIYATAWSQLQPTQRQSAELIGYAEDVWDGCSYKSRCLVRLKLLEEKMARRWPDLSDGTRARLSDLGWTSRSYTDGNTPLPYTIPWNALASAQYEAAVLLGYHHDTWAVCAASPCKERFLYVEAHFKNVPWSSMRVALRRAWMLLGYSSEGWGPWKDMNHPASMQMGWDFLVPEQQAAARILGHTRGTWEGCAGVASATNTSLSSIAALPVDPNRAVRALMNIQRPFAEISGNLHGVGSNVASMPTSFIIVFVRSVSRALFCGNPALSEDNSPHVDGNGQTICVNTEAWQRQRHRIQVLSVVEGSIITEFIIRANVTADEPTAEYILGALQRQLASPLSPIAHDPDFGRFAVVANVKEVSMLDLRGQKLQEQAGFENLRKSYDETNMCNLKADGRRGKVVCVIARADQGCLVTAVWAIMLTMALFR